MPQSGAGAPRWTAEQANAWYAKQPWPVGCNFVPSSAVNDTEMWQKETFDPTTIDREVGWAQSLGFNTCRVFLQYIVWNADPRGFRSRFDRFLSIASRHGMTVIPVLFDDCAFDANREPYLGKQDDPIPGVHNSRWVPSPGHKLAVDTTAWPSLRKYVGDLVGGHRSDRRVLAWDLYNEPGNSGMGEKSLPLLEAVFGWAREAKPDQPLTVGCWGGPKALEDREVELSDVISFHFYGDHAGLAAHIEQFKKYGRPAICTEWFARTFGSSMAADLPLFKAEKVGCACAALVNGRIQTNFPWGSPPGGPEPKVWFHDLFRHDGTPYDPAEVAAIRKIIRQPSPSRSCSTSHSSGS